MTTRRTKIAALVAGCAVVAGGAYAATDALSSSQSPAAAVSSANGTGQQANAQNAQTDSAGAALSSAISDAAGTGTASTPAQRTAQRRAARRAIRRLRLLGGEYGQFTFQTKKGPRTVAFERGTIVSVAGSDVTVRAVDGDTMTWVLYGKSAVRKAGSKLSASALSAGEKVLVAGPVTGTTRDARLIVIGDPGARPGARKRAAASTS